MRTSLLITSSLPSLFGSGHRRHHQQAHAAGHADQGAQAQRQLQQLRMQMKDLQRQYDDAVKRHKHLQCQMSSDCTSAMKDIKGNQHKFTCDLDSLAFAPRSEEKKTAGSK